VYGFVLAHIDKAHTGFNSFLEGAVLLLMVRDVIDLAQMNQWLKIK